MCFMNNLKQAAVSFLDYSCWPCIDPRRLNSSTDAPTFTLYAPTLASPASSERGLTRDKDLHIPIVTFRPFLSIEALQMLKHSTISSSGSAVRPRSSQYRLYSMSDVLPLMLPLFSCLSLFNKCSYALLIVSQTGISPCLTENNTVVLQTYCIYSPVDFNVKKYY